MFFDQAADLFGSVICYGAETGSFKGDLHHVEIIAAVVNDRTFGLYMVRN